MKKIYRNYKTNKSQSLLFQMELFKNSDGFKIRLKICQLINRKLTGICVGNLLFLMQKIRIKIRFQPLRCEESLCFLSQ